ncbi:uncharacterized protein T551_00322 [Pneumocystis jirovecii RU7]|uniref:Uncharacterized protein n=1 Tax=Pneumocystis jirovecii (strain RU7) TaxID=1408657 RepID=A0A0W4ZWT2_PNEJ7|nr:uncharacterized protein T551_00322 [Pneumocystis jirovecii RU7]KTW32837.1 hypothetical protein T551_00322 [Pneumocystis jirovecii RU7]
MKMCKKMEKLHTLCVMVEKSWPNSGYFGSEPIIIEGILCLSEWNLKNSDLKANQIGLNGHRDVEDIDYMISATRITGDTRKSLFGKVDILVITREFLVLHYS